MYCRNCGNKLEDGAYVCTKCGVLASEESSIKIKNKKESNVLGILSIIFSSLAVLISLDLLTDDISFINMYTNAMDKIVYIISHVGLSMALVIVSLILAFTNRKNICNKIGLSLSLLSLFFIITEIVVVILY